jgi:hypothetical protein
MTKKTEKQPQPQGGKKLRRLSKRNYYAAYKSGERFTKNQKRKVSRHLKANPHDDEALRHYRRIAGTKDVTLPKLNHKGRKLSEIYQARRALHS